jgi:hypothetical protein
VRRVGAGRQRTTPTNDANERRQRTTRGREMHCRCILPSCARRPLVFSLRSLPSFSWRASRDAPPAPTTHHPKKLRIRVSADAKTLPATLPSKRAASKMASSLRGTAPTVPPTAARVWQALSTAWRVAAGFRPRSFLLPSVQAPTAKVARRMPYVVSRSMPSALAVCRQAIR